jgi:hypothetical protein
MTARKTSTVPTQIWSFGARPPTEGAERVAELCRRATDYYDRLIAIEVERQREYRDTRDHYAPELAELRSALADTLLSTLPRAERDPLVREAGSRLAAATEAFERTLAPARAAYEERTSGAPAELLAELRAARAARKSVPRGTTKAERAAAKAERVALDQRLAQLSKQKRSCAPPPATKSKLNERVLAEMLGEEAWPEAWKDLAQAESSAREQAKTARAASGLTKGCYLRVEVAVDQARAAKAREVRPLCERSRPADRWQIAVQLTPPLTWRDAVLGRDTRLRIALPASSKRKRNGHVRIRVGSNPDRSPIWATFPVRVHRPLRDDAVIKWAWIQVAQIGDKLRYDLQLTNEAESYRRVPPESGQVSVSIVESRIRSGWLVARWSGDDEDSGSVELPDELCRRLSYGDAIAKARQTLGGDAWRVLRLVARRSGNRLSGWYLRDEFAIHAIARSWSEHVLGEHARRLWERWRAERITGRLDLYVPAHELSRHAPVGLGPTERFAWWVQLWTRKDSHLRRLALDVSAHARRGRDERYRVLARQLSRRYRVLEIEQHSLVPLEDDAAAKLRRVLATGRLREVLLEKFTDDFVVTARTAEITLDRDARALNAPSVAPAGAE